MVVERPPPKKTPNIFTLILTNYKIRLLSLLPETVVKVAGVLVIFQSICNRCEDQYNV